MSSLWRPIQVGIFDSEAKVQREAASLLSFVVAITIRRTLSLRVGIDRDSAKLAGAAWLITGVLYYGWLTSGFRRNIAFASSVPDA